MTKANLPKVPISMRALMQRLNRALAKQDEQLRRTAPPRGEGFSQQWLDCGDYFIVNTRGNYLAQKSVNVEKLGRSLGVLREWESVAE